MSFDEWVTEAVNGWGLDGQVIGGYIASIVSSRDEDADEKRRQVSDILDGSLQDVDAKIERIMDEWSTKYDVEQRSTADETIHDRLDVDERLAMLLAKQSPIAHAPRMYTDDELRIREAVLKYARLADDAEEQQTAEVHHHPHQEHSADHHGGGGDLLTPNTNAANVAAQAKERRERAKAESQRKKEKDKEDRDKQKQMREDKKEKRKTQKGERKR